MTSVDASDARSIVDPGGTQEAPATDAAVAPTRASRDAPPQERGDDVDASLSTARSASPQDSAGGDDATVPAAIETSSSGMGAVDVIPAHPRPLSLHSPIPSTRPSLVSSATVPTVVETNPSGDNAPPSHVLPSDDRSGHPQVNDPTDQALIKTGSSNSGVVDVHGTTSLPGASGVRISSRPQESGASKQVTVTAAGEASSSNTYAASPAFAPLGLSSARSSTPTPSSAAVDDSFVSAAVDASSDGTSAVNVDTSSALRGLSLPLPNPSTSRVSSNNCTISGPVVEGSSVPHGATGCTATNQLQEVAELLKHAGNLLSRLGSSHAPNVHAPPNDNMCTACSCACAQNPHPPPSVSEVTGDARAVSAAAATPAPAAATSGRGGAPVNQAADIQDSCCSGPPAKDPQDTQQTSSAAQQVPSGSQALPGQLTGWAAVEKALKEFDQQEIGGYKEDIDSLLTFTGLYSAVLTAFVIVSYPLLQDPNQASASISMSTPSTPSTPSSPFQPPITAIRINILWFASLVISLATASFAILVKQWLRAYMAFATASPQGQLRVRHFRRSGLTAWRVFGIASTLPLLLQMSLALFFAGLCIFTWDVHPTLGKTTLPLVAAWAFLFLVVTITPSFTARCPYTTPALAGITCVVRTHVYAPVARVIVKHIPHGIVWTLYRIFDWMDDHTDIFVIQSACCLFDDLNDQLREYELLLPEEMDMQKNVQHDLRILAAADALQADDHLLRTTIKSALEQSDANWVQLVEFAVEIIGNRIPVVDGEINPEHISKAYRTLSPMVQEVIYQIFRSHAVPKLAENLEIDAGSVDFPKNWKIIAWWAFCTFIHIPSTNPPLLPLCLDENQLARIGQQTDVIKRWYLEQLNLAVALYRTSGFMSAGIGKMGEYTPLQLTFQWALQTSKEDTSAQKILVQQCLIFDHAIICQIFDAVYTHENDIHQLSNMIHNIVNYDGRDFWNLKAIEILKLSLLSVKVMYGKISANRDSRPRWSSDEAAQWKRIFIWLANGLWILHPFIDLSPDELAALRDLARSGWRGIPDPAEDSSQEALPLPDFFYLMLWRTAGKDLSQIPSQHPQLLRIAHMSHDEGSAIEWTGVNMARAYWENSGNLYPPGTENDNGEGPEGRATSAPAQGTHDPIPNDSRVDAEEVGVYGGLQGELPTDTSDIPFYDSKAPSEAEVRAADTTEQYSWTDSGQAGGTQPGRTPFPMHEVIHDSEDTELSSSERQDDGDGLKQPNSAIRPAEAAGDTAEVEDRVLHQTSGEGGASPRVTNSQTTPTSLPTSSCDETIPVDTKVDLEPIVDSTQVSSTLDHIAPSPSLPDDTAGEGSSRLAEAVTTGSFDNNQGLSGERNEAHARADVEVNTCGEVQTAKAEGRAVE